MSRAVRRPRAIYRAQTYFLTYRDETGGLDTAGARTRDDSRPLKYFLFPCPSHVSLNYKLLQVVPRKMRTRVLLGTRGRVAVGVASLLVCLRTRSFGLVSLGPSSPRWTVLGESRARSGGSVPGRWAAEGGWETATSDARLWCRAWVRLGLSRSGFVRCFLARVEGPGGFRRRPSLGVAGPPGPSGRGESVCGPPLRTH